MLETYYFQALQEFLEGKEQSTIVSTPNDLLMIIGVLCECNRPEDRIFGEYTSQQVQLNPLLYINHLKLFLQGRS